MRWALAGLLAGTLFASAPRAEGDAPPVPEATLAPVIDAIDDGGAPEAASGPDDATLESNGAVIGEITIRAEDIFDPEAPGENNVFFRAANKIHIVTREGVIRRQLLFAPGDRYSARVIAESARGLRANGYLYDAAIRTTRYDGERVDIEVRTRDVWTLQGGIGFGRSGGKNSTRFGLQDQNFLGSGKDLMLKRTSNVDRTETAYRYGDPALFGTRGRLRLFHSANSDGQASAVAIERPFYSLETRWALGANARQDKRIESLYDLGIVTGRIQHDNQAVTVYAGRSRGIVNGRAKRLLYGFTHETDRYQPATDAAGALDAPPSEERVASYPWIGYESLTDGFVTARDLDKLRRTEDLNLGREVRARIGLSTSAFGGDRTCVLYDASFSQGINPGNGQLLFVRALLAGRFADRAVENVTASGGGRYYLRGGEHTVFFASLRGDVAHDLDPGVQLLLGGDSGLRGYPLRYLSGDRRLLLTVEERFYSDRHVLKLVHVGAAVFFDAGSAWQSGDASGANRPLLKDIGLGLRFSSSRSSKGSLLKVDLAFPLDRLPGIAHSQFTITAGDTF